MPCLPACWIRQRGMHKCVIEEAGVAVSRCSLFFALFFLGFAVWFCFCCDNSRWGCAMCLLPRAVVVMFPDETIADWSSSLAYFVQRRMRAGE